MTTNVILADINSVVGVDGSFLVDDAGNILQSHMPAASSADALAAAARRLSRARQSLGRIGIKVRDLDVSFERGRMFGRWLVQGALFIVCRPTINLPLLNMTANMALDRLNKGMAEERERDRRLKKLHVEINDGFLSRRKVVVVDGDVLADWSRVSGVRSVDSVTIARKDKAEFTMKVASKSGLGPLIRMTTQDATSMGLADHDEVVVRPA